MILIDLTFNDIRVIARETANDKMLVEFHCLLRGSTVLKIMDLSDLCRIVSFAVSKDDKTVPETTYEDAIRLLDWLPNEDDCCRPIY